VLVEVSALGGFGVGWEREGKTRTTTGRLDCETGSGEGKLRKGDEKGS